MKRSERSESRGARSKHGFSLVGGLYYDFTCAVHNWRQSRQKGLRDVRSEKTKDLLFVWVILSLSLVGVAVFWVYVNWSSIFMAFENPNGGYWLGNFKIIFEELKVSGSQISESLRNTMIFFFVGFFISMPLNYLFSYFIYKKIAGVKFFRVVFFLPAIVSAVVLTSFFKFMLYPDGPIPPVWVSLFGGESPIFFANSSYALPTIVVFSIWAGLGPGFLMNVAAMSRIPSDVLEYAQIDGVSHWQEFTKIIFPLIWPFISMNIFMGLTGILGASGPVLLFTNGNYGTMTLSHWLYLKTIGGASYLPQAAALGLMMTLVNLPFAIGFRALADRVEPVEY